MFVRRRTSWAAALVLGVCFSGGLASARAEAPPYLVLERPHATIFGSPYPQAVKVRAQPYPYGYFGACASPHWQRQFGINRTYTQWGRK